ncbi:DUF427 domain-containing protein [Truepera radiovictrix]|uniref:DUF427 domain-containing protein n=1 Tax=Truepera radiovictrix (strain DSM 17093 / CIP 108686 / LMG 22925 / RQ-24) TaxID=649638 RepID=D7CQ77_TRURR|nr:DUF427 domain-containing protein [Truepera radiovictrix]ADI14861.1 protein of unknown function DUF427 [Truepera radiovictrix DSM 17093]WMT56588.1 DUF427 domain-containing protein [Truepera radiovictrix]
MPKAEFRGVTLAESAHTEVVEGNHYFPREAVAMALLEPSATRYTCPWKGEAEYFHLTVAGERVDDAAWSYPHPKAAAKRIANHLAFDTSKGIRVA